MRPLMLTICGFGPFADETTIDFTQLGTEGLYLVTGPTGAGKSTIFDAISFALYGESATHGRENESLRSDHAAPDTPTFVRLEFALRGETYTIERTPPYQRPSKRKKGALVDQAASVVLTLPDGSVQTSIPQAGRTVAELLGLQREQFSQIVMIAQGDFQRLLKADSATRIALFRRLFQTGWALELQKLLGKRERGLAAQSQQGRERALAAAQRATVDEALLSEGADEAEPGAQEALPLFDEDDPAEAAVSLMAWRQSQGTQPEKAAGWLDVLVAHDETLAEKAQDLDRAVTSERESVTTALAQEEARRAALQEKAQLEETLAALEPDLAAAAQAVAEQDATAPRREALQAAIAVETQALASYAELTGAVAAEQRAQEAQRQLADRTQKAKDAHDRAAQRYDDLARQTQTPEMNEAAEQAVRDVLAQAPLEERRLASATERAQTLLEEESERAAASTSANEAAEKAARAYGQARRAADEAADSYRQAKRAFDDGAAGRLAQALVAGEPCPVCGATEHPRPAAVLADVPGEQAVQKAEQQMRALEATASEAAVASGSAQAASAAAADALEAFHQQEGTAEALQAALAQARDERAALDRRTADARAAVARIERLHRDVDRAQQEVADRAEALRQLAEHRAEAEKAAALATQRVATLRSGLPYPDEAAATAARDAKQAELGRLTAAAQQAADRLQELKDQRARCSGRLEQASKRLSELPEQDLEALQAQAAALDARKQANDELRTAIAARLSVNRQAAAELRTIAREQAALEQEAADVSALSRAANGSGRLGKVTFETYLQMHWLDQVLAAANQRYWSMSDERYELVRRDPSGNRSATGLAINVKDAYTGKVRSAGSLSGGESFEASLALALGLSDVVQAHAGGISLDCMFVDEGFGTLDPEALNRTVRALTQLTGGHKLVGAISHVPAMREAIDKQIVVTPSETGSSVSIEA